ncbi:hypothetical protein AVEN_99704-1 [Araneus ventricosus]|uniref:PDEase domain-containing protein n=1 Tax=Araneus ventricosus TaxID=182803 RepID=A0A4Y2TWC9_ARAVE|nr:hypothetical protein AVEN_189832-1 [Araneus ventricosus]GBO04796.1 hypothetical protein AVEN_43867-1 [Araneus ventricosus]GBO04949.1 hypothetical protein AVEN_99704-1 [Araneus ventricosus]
MTELCYFLTCLKANYHNVEYHNYSHALSHAQSMYWILKKTPGVFTELEMTRAAPEPAPPLQISALHKREDIWHDGFNVHDACLYCGSSVESAFELGAFWPQSQDLVTRIQTPEVALRQKF